ncbi:Apm4p ASCRUDRAFT_9779 [Ascoidea rubescens DSM 1968]|uniref:MHD domain-containing protein n=1 Tax=Ascoidea rubescens DSM 1968 TaxID=1344418 RepID=A0A1D2VC29_9ASCO|nr:hypothetical protein ASCRUDRAFT_9779 [Ascoidea rubescens DSM 1968]ODV59027.1 hypothetical protein ASCRUDRAFT_9779 [Ascoidea rubescens DSM 1968]
MISAFFIFNQKGEVIISRIFRDDIKKTISDVFRIQVISSANNIRSPILTLGSTTFLHIKNSNLWFVAITRSNQDASIIFEFLYKFLDLLNYYILNQPVSSIQINLSSSNNAKSKTSSKISDNKIDTSNLNNLSLNLSNNMSMINNNLSNANNNLININNISFLTDQHIKNNFFWINELLDEIMDFGYPQNMEPTTLKQYIQIPQPSSTTNSLKNLISLNKSKDLLSSTNNQDNKQSNNNNNKNNKNKNSSDDIKDDNSNSTTATKNHNSSSNANLTKQSTSEISWRPLGIKYRKNEVFLDVYENLNLLMSANSSILRLYIDGYIKMKSHLSGMPECKFGLNDSLFVNGNEFAINTGILRKSSTNLSNFNNNNNKVKLEDCKFHQCVQLNKFDQNRLITFIPPDGDFELMRYRAMENIKLPFEIMVKVKELSKTRMEYNIKIKSLYEKNFNSNLLINIPVPTGTIKFSNAISGGKARFIAEDNIIVWKINKFPGNLDHFFKGNIEIVPSQANIPVQTANISSNLLNLDNDDTNDTYNNDKNLINSFENMEYQNIKTSTITNNLINWSRPPISLIFTLNSFSCSGLTVKYLKVVEKSGYSTVKWVRYIAKAGSYEIRY